MVSGNGASAPHQNMVGRQFPLNAQENRMPMHQGMPMNQMP